MEDPLPKILFIFVVIIIKGLFSLTETALLSSRKTWLRTLAEEGDKKYHQALEIVENPLICLSALRIAIMLLEILAGAVGGFSIARFLAQSISRWKEIAPFGAILGIAVVTVGITLVAIFLGDTIPKQIALAAPEKITAAALPLIKTLAVIFRPFIGLSSRLSNLIIRLLNTRWEIKTGMTEDELRIALREGEKSGIVESEERTMVEKVFYLGDRPVGAFMIHRSEVQRLDINAGPEEVRKMVEAYKDQRFFPISEGGIDEVDGSVSVQDLLFCLLEGSWPGLKALMKPPYFIPETMSALKAFEAFKKTDANGLFVMDEYGGFSGLLTVRNLIEEIVGRLSDAEEDKGSITKAEDGLWFADGAVSIDDAAQALSLNQLGAEPQGLYPEFHTLAGFILDLAGEIPRSGASYTYGEFSFKILSLEGNRIDKIRISRIKV